MIKEKNDITHFLLTPKDFRFEESATIYCFSHGTKNPQEKSTGMKLLQMEFSFSISQPNRPYPHLNTISYPTSLIMYDIDSAKPMLLG